MTWDHLEAAAFSAAIRSHRSASATPAPARISQRPSAASSLWPAGFTDAMAKRVALSWLMDEQRHLMKERIRAAQAKNHSEVFSIFERTLRVDQALRFLHEIQPRAILLTEDMRVDDPLADDDPVTADELAQAVVLGLRLEGSTD